MEWVSRRRTRPRCLCCSVRPDRRVRLCTSAQTPERAGEAAIVADSTALRSEALRRIDQIEGGTPAPFSVVRGE